MVNKKCNVPSEERRALRQELHFCQKFGISGHMARAGIDGPEDRYLAQLLDVYKRQELHHPLRPAPRPRVRSYCQTVPERGEGGIFPLIPLRCV